MLKILGKATSNNVRKVLWTCAEIDIPYDRPTGPPSKRARQLERTHIGMLESQLARTGAFVVGASFTLADVVIGLSLNRWLMTPMDRPDLPAVRRCLERLSRRRGFSEHVANGAHSCHNDDLISGRSLRIHTSNENPTGAVTTANESGAPLAMSYRA